MCATKLVLVHSDPSDPSPSCKWGLVGEACGETMSAVAPLRKPTSGTAALEHHWGLNHLGRTCTV